MVTFSGRFFFSKTLHTAQKNANFSSPVFGPENLLSGFEQSLFNRTEIKPSVENTAQGQGIIHILKIGLKWDVGCA